MKKRLTAVVVSLACAAAMLAHGGMEHVMGIREGDRRGQRDG
jgi:hypothetical protein